MRVLIACESSGAVRDAFIANGHDALSCDLLPTETPGPHYQGDVFDVIDDGWDLMIAHPPCTYLNVAAAWALNDPDFEKYPDGGYHQKVKPGTLVGEERRQAQHEAVIFFMNMIGCGFVNHGIPRVAVENPVGMISTAMRKADQYIHPYEFGDDASKATGLWLVNLPKLKPTKRIEPRMVDGKPRWANQTDGGQNKLPPSKDRWKLRSKTYPGIAKAMAEQWGQTSFAGLQGKLWR